MAASPPGATIVTCQHADQAAGSSDAEVVAATKTDQSDLVFAGKLTCRRELLWTRFRVSVWAFPFLRHAAPIRWRTFVSNPCTPEIRIV